MEWMTGGEALVRSLAANDVRVIFGLPGVQLYGVMVALREHPEIRLITTRHEQATSYMADGYARASGEIGVALVVPGQGLLNAAAGLSTAYSVSSPVLMIAGQVPRGQIGKKLGLLHEIDDQQGAISSITKWRGRVTDVEDVPAAVRDAITQLRTGRPRPVELEMPPETMEDEGEAELLASVPRERSLPNAGDLDRAAERLLSAERAVIYAGGGVHRSGANEALAGLAAHLQAGVVTSPEGKGAIDDRSDLSLGSGLSPGSAAREYLNSADLILAVGTRLGRAAFGQNQPIIHIDVDPTEIGRVYGNSAGLVGDARATLESLLDRLRAAGPARPSRADERLAVRARMAERDTHEPQSSILRSLRAGTPEDAIVVAGMTQVGYYSRSYWPTYAPRTYISPGYSGNLGFEYPTALGAKVAMPDRPVIAIVGDGGFLYNASELATAVQHGINVVTVVFNDGAYGNVSRDLDESWGGTYGAELHNPDFVKLADAYGAIGLRAAIPIEVGDLVRKAVGLDRPVIIDVPVGRMPRDPSFAGPRPRVRRPL